MAAKKQASSAPVSLTWKRGVADSEGLPIKVGAPAAIAKHDDEEGPAEYVEVIGAGDEAYVLLDTEGGGSADVGYDDADTVIVLATSDVDAKKVPKIIGRSKEYLVGEISVPASGELAIDAFRLPRTPGAYTVVEGHHEGDDGELRWCRLTPAGRKTYAPRPAEPKDDPVAWRMARISFDGPKEEARALEAALELVDLGRPDLALEVCAKASSARRVLASYTRVFALAAQHDAAALREATTLAEEWLRPADSVDHASQTLPRAQLLRALDAAGVEATLRDRVTNAVEPETYVPEGDFF